MTVGPPPDWREWMGRSTDTLGAPPRIEALVRDEVLAEVAAALEVAIAAGISRAKRVNELRDEWWLGGLRDARAVVEHLREQG